VTRLDGGSSRRNSGASLSTPTLTYSKATISVAENDSSDDAVPTPSSSQHSTSGASAPQSLIHRRGRYIFASMKRAQKLYGTQENDDLDMKIMKIYSVKRSVNGPKKGSKKSQRSRVPPLCGPQDSGLTYEVQKGCLYCTTDGCVGC
jgi:hypothetical protein